MTALIFRDQNGWSVEVYTRSGDARRQFEKTRDAAGGQATGFTWEDGKWIADSGTDECHVTNAVEIM